VRILSELVLRVLGIVESWPLIGGDVSDCFVGFALSEVCGLFVALFLWF